MLHERFSTHFEIVGLPEAQLNADPTLLDSNQVRTPTDGANKGKHKTGIAALYTYAQLPFDEDTASGAASWGTITGTITSQTDLMAVFGLRFTFDASTVDADPGAGDFRFNNGTFGSVTRMYLDNSDVNGNDVSGLTSQWPSSGILYFKQIDGAGEMAFALGAVAAGGVGYIKIDLTPIIGALPTAGTVWALSTQPQSLNAGVTAALAAKASTASVAAKAAYFGGALQASWVLTNITGVTTGGELIVDLAAITPALASAEFIGGAAMIPSGVFMIARLHDSTIGTYTVRYVDHAGAVPPDGEAVCFTVIGIPA